MHARILTALALAIMAFGPAIATAQTADLDEGLCAQAESSKTMASLMWLEVADGDSEAETETLTLQLSNLTTETYDAEIEVLVDFGGTKNRRKSFKLDDVAAEGSTRLAIPIRKLGIKPREMEFSGQIYAKARLTNDRMCSGGACDALRTLEPDAADAELGAAAGPRVLPAGERARVDEPYGDGAEIVPGPSIFFHTTEGSAAAAFYGANLMAGRYGGGDLGGALNPPADGMLLRAVKLGKGGKHTNKLLPELSIADLDAEHEGAPSAGPSGPGNLASGEYGICVRWEIGLSDAGKTLIVGDGTKITEDYWNGHPKGGGNGFLKAANGKKGNMVVAARGVRVGYQINPGDPLTYVDTNPKTGCFSFKADLEGPVRFWVYTHHTDSRGNQTIYRSSLNLPYVFYAEMTPQINKVRTLVVGKFTPQATLAAISGFAMYRTTFGNENTTMEIINVNTCGKDDEGNPNSDGANNSSAHFDSSDLDIGVAHLRINDGTGPKCDPNDHRRRKFLITHEMGHAWQLLRTKQYEPDPDSDLEDPFESQCSQGKSYSVASMEYSSIGAREGIAHFYATEVWNSHSSGTALFNWFGKAEDVEYNKPHEDGGRLWNTCNSPTKCGRSTIIDWLRHFWDWHTPFEPGKANVATMAAVYEDAITGGGLDRANYFEGLSESVESLVGSAAQRNEWYYYAKLNGVDTSPSGPSCIADFGYPDCPFEDPNDGAGTPGCACDDVSEVSFESDVRDDGFYPDGPGSYLENGLSGTGQYCHDGASGAGSVGVCGIRGVKDAPVCLTCGVDTMYGCACEMDSDCEGFNDGHTLECWGDAGEGWPGGNDGICLPTASTQASLTELNDRPWFCLENCGSRGGGQPSSWGCVYDQFEPTVSYLRAQCTDLVFCSAPAGFCEAQGLRCDPDATCGGDFQDCCVEECMIPEDCAGLAFPASYTCDTDGGLAGSCVPAGCDAPGADEDFCGMFR